MTMINTDDYPSVTQILPPPERHVSPARWAELRGEGNYRHDLMKMYFDFGIIVDPWQEKFAELIESKKLEWGKLICCEKRLVSEKYKFHGKPDMIFENAIVDLKSTYDKKMNALQLSGYWILVQEKYWNLSISDISVIDKDLKLRTYDKDFIVKAKDIFIDCLNKYYAQKRIDYYFLAEKYKGEK